MPSTITIAANLGATGLAGTAGFVVYNADWTVFQSRAASVSTIAQIASTTTYKGSFSGDPSATYYHIWDNGGSPPAYSGAGTVNPGVNVATVANVMAIEGDGTAAAVAAGTITLDASDPQNAANLAGWQVRILSAGGGTAGQVATIQSSNTGTHVQTLTANWAATPSGTVVYQLSPPVNASVSLGGNAPDGWIRTATFAANTTLPRVTLTDTATTLTNGPSFSLGSTAPAGWINTAAFAAGATIPRVTLADTATTLTNGPSFSLGSNAPAGWLNAAAFATDAIGAAAVSAAAVTKVQAGLATPTNITAGTITTVTNLTNAPTSGDLTAAMKTSLNAATPTVFLAGSGLNNVMIESNYNLKQAMKVILAACGNIIVGNGTTTVTVGNTALPTPTTGSNTVITATMTGVALVNGVPTAVDRTAIPSVVLSNA